MDGGSFDRLTRTLAAGGTRRRLLGALGGALLGLAGVASGSARPRPKDCLRKCGPCETCKGTGPCESSCAPDERCRGTVCVPACESRSCQAFDAATGQCRFTCLPCERCRQGHCVDACPGRLCRVCSPDGRECVSACGAGETCVRGDCTHQCGPCQTFDLGTDTCTPPCPVEGQVRNPKHDCACECPDGSSTCGGDAVCGAQSTVGMCCAAPDHAACCCDSSPGVGDGWAVCCGGTKACPTCPSGDTFGGAVTQCGSSGGAAVRECPS